MYERIQRRIARACKQAAHGLRPSTATKQAIVLVVGVQRSGTNMVMEVFDRSWKYAVFHDNDPRAFKDFAPRPFDELRALIERQSAPFVALKPMTEMFRLRSMLDQLVHQDRGERGVGLWVYRRMGDVVDSHVKRWTGMPDSMRRIAAEPDWPNWRAGGISESSLELIRRCATDDLDNATACALFWYVRNVQFFEQRIDSMPDVAVLPYERCVADPDREFGRLLGQFDLPFHLAMTRRVHANRVARKASPNVRPEVQQACDALERRFDEHLARLPRPSPGTS
jgi:hypothetical protein